jgi:hypothetical protein
MVHYISPPPQGPLARVVAGIVAALMLIGAVTLGLVAFVVIAILAALAGIAIWLRVWWLKRRLEQQGFRPHESQRPGSSGHVIDAEYTVVDDTGDPPDRQH